RREQRGDSTGLTSYSVRLARELELRVLAVNRLHGDAADAHRALAVADFVLGREAEHGVLDGSRTAVLAGERRELERGVAERSLRSLAAGECDLGALGGLPRRDERRELGERTAVPPLNDVLDRFDLLVGD